ncbi:MAG: two-component regulator propeller domain-containing protein [Bacteroidota bacterium]
MIANKLNINNIIKGNFLIIFLSFQIICYISLSLPAFSQHNLKTYSIEDGLSQSQVYSIFQDSRGNLWIGTYGGGVCKYDGRSFTKFTTKDGLSNNIVYSIIEDRAGNLWFGTYGGGINKYDGLGFTQYTEEDGLSNNYVYSIVEDTKGNLWIGTYGGGVSVLAANKENFMYIHTTMGLSSNKVTAILEDSRGNIWFGTEGGGVSLLEIKQFNEDIRQFLNNNGQEQPRNIQWKYFTAGNGLIDDRVYSILEDHNGNIWFGTFGGGVNILLEKERTDNKEDDVESGELWKYITVDNGLCDNRITSLLEDGSGYIWIGTYGGGACKIRAEITNTSLCNFTNYTETDGLGNNIVWAVSGDNSGNIWLGTEGGGLSKYVSEIFTHYKAGKGLTNNIVFSIIEDSHDNLWFGTFDRGVSKMVMGELEDSLGNIERTYGKSFISYSSKHGLNDNNIVTMMEDRTGKIWIGTYNGVSVYDPGVEGVQKMKHKKAGIAPDYFYQLKQLGDNMILSIYEDKPGNIWFGSDGGGLMRFNPNKYDYNNPGSKNNESAIQRFSVNDGLNNDMVWSILEDRSGVIWLGTWGGGVSKLTLNSSEVADDNQKPYDKNERSFKIENITKDHGLSNNFVLSILEDAIGNLWFGTYGGGISILRNPSAETNIQDREKGMKKSVYEWLYITDENGLSDDGIVLMVFDDHGNIWAGTNKGINRITPPPALSPAGTGGEHQPKKLSGRSYITGKEGKVNWTIRQYGKLDGFIGIECNQNAVCKDKKGNIWFGTANVLTRYNADVDMLNTIEPKSHITGLRLFFEEVDWEGIAPDTSPRLHPNRRGKPNANQFSRASAQLEEEDMLEGIKYDNISKWYSLPQNLVLPYDKNHLTFDFIGISLKIPDKVRYQYMLKGLDDVWSPPVKENFATYHSVPHGKYTFMVKACNNDGIWNKEPATFSFVITPPFWKTWWFYTLCVLIVAASIYIAVLLRIRNLQKAKKELTKQVKLRTKELRQEKILVEKQKIELERTHNNLNKTYNKLKELEGFKNEMMGMIVHDLKNPLNAVLGFSKRQPTKTILENIYQSGRQMLNLVMNILDVQKFEDAEVKLNLKNHLLIRVLEDAIQQVKVLVKQKDLIIENNVGNKVICMLDYENIARVFINLLTNAIKFTPLRGKIIINAIKVMQGKDEMIKVMVSDTGTGIPKEKISSVFDRFSQVISKDSGQTGSTGIGLTFCKMTVEAHGGKIGAESEPGKGSTFYFTLPEASDITVEDREGEIKEHVQKAKLSEIDKEEAEEKIELLFSEADKKNLLPVVEKFEGLTVYHSSENMYILNQIEFKNNKVLQKWYEEMETAVSNCDEEKYNELLGLIK